MWTAGFSALQSWGWRDGLGCKHIQGFIPLARRGVVRVKGKGQGALVWWLRSPGKAGRGVDRS